MIWFWGVHDDVDDELEDAVMRLSDRERVETGREDRGRVYVMSDVKSNGVLRLFGVERDEKWKEDRGRFCVMREAKSNGERRAYVVEEYCPTKAK